MGTRARYRRGWPRSWALPQIGYARSISLDGDTVQVVRSVDETVETLESAAPVVVTVVSEINEPTIPSLMNIMKAGKKPVTEWTLADLGLDAAAVASSVTTLSNLAEEQDRKRIMLAGESGRGGRGAAERAGQRRRGGEIAMADILVYSEKNDTALELLSKGRELAGALGLGLSAAALGAGAAGNAASLGEHGAGTCLRQRGRGTRRPARGRHWPTRWRRSRARPTRRTCWSVRRGAAKSSPPASPRSWARGA